jgi:hypothetical protein
MVGVLSVNRIERVTSGEFVAAMVDEVSLACMQLDNVRSEINNMHKDSGILYIVTPR